MAAVSESPQHGVESAGQNRKRGRLIGRTKGDMNTKLHAVADAQGRRVARELTALIEWRGNPGMIVSDPGKELTSNAIPKWCAEANCPVLASESLRLKPRNVATRLAGMPCLRIVR